MANIQQNETYENGEEPKIPTVARPGILGVMKQNEQPRPSVPSISSSAGLVSMVQGFSPYGYDTQKKYQENIGKLVGGTAEMIPPNTPVEKPETFQRYTPIPQDYSGFVNPYKPTEARDTPTGARIRSIPGTEGQYLVNVEQPTQQLRTARGYSPEEKALLLKGRPTSMWQIDHNIPIWAGGADTLANKQVLSISDHRDKTKAQAVPLTLMANGLMNRDQARMLALAWKDKDLSDVPDPDETGMLSIDDAKKIYDRWQKQEKYPGYGTLLGAPLKDVIAGIPEQAKEMGKGIIPDSVREFTKGMLSGATGGWIPYEQEKPGALSTASGFVGGVVGMIPIVRGLSSLLRLSGQTLMGTQAASRFIKPPATGVNEVRTIEPIEKAPEISKELTRWGKVKKAGSELGTSAGLAGKSLSIRPVSAKDEKRIADFIKSGAWGSSLVKNLRYGTLASDTGALLLYGQISKDGFENRTENFLTNLAYATATGFVPNNIKGAVTAAGLTTLIGIMSHGYDEDGVRNAFITGTTIGVMHALGAKGTDAALNKRMEEITPILEKALKQDAYTATQHVLHPFLPENFKLPTPGEDIPIGGYNKYTDDELNAMQAQAEAKNAAIGQYTSQQTLENNLAKIRSAFQFLRNENMPEAKRANAYAEDLISTKNRLNDYGSFTTPPEAFKVAEIIANKNWMKNSWVKHDGENQLTYKKTEKDGTTTDVPFPSGFMRAAGLGTDDLEPAAAKFLVAQSKNNTSPVLFGVWTPELEPIVRQINASYSKDQIINMEKSPSARPSNVLQIYGVINNADGSTGLVRVGFASRKFKIGSPNPAEPQSKTSYAQAEYAKDFRKKHDDEIEGTDWNINKDEIIDAANANGSKVVLFNFLKGGFSKKQNKPWMVLSLNDETWANSLQLAKSMEMKAVKTPIESQISHINNSIDAKKQVESIQSVKEKITAPSTEIVKKLPVGDNPVFHDSVEDFITKFNDALTTKTVNGISDSFKKDFGIKLTPDESAYLLRNEGSITNRQMFDVIGNARKEGRMDPVMSVIYANQVVPYFSSPMFKESAYGRTFPDLKVMGGIKKPDPYLQKPSIATEPTIKQVATPSEVTPKEIPTILPQTKQEEIPVEQMDPIVNLLVNKSKESIPQKKKIEPVPPETPKIEQQAPVTPKPVESVTQEVKTAPETKITQPEVKREPWLMPKTGIPKWASGPKITFATNRQNVTKSSRQDEEVSRLIKKGREMIMSFKPVIKRGGKDTTATLSRKIASMVNSLSPRGNFSKPEEKTIKDQVRGRLMGYAEEHIKDSINVEQEIAFKTGATNFDDGISKIMKAVTNANIVSSLGDNERARLMLKQYNLKDVVESARILGLAGEDKNSGILSILKGDKEYTKDLEGSYLPLTRTQEYSMGKRKEEEGKKIIRLATEGLKQGPGTSAHATAFAIDKFFKDLFGKNYNTNTKILKKIGEIETKKRGRSTFASAYEETKKEFGEEVTHTPEYIEAMATGKKKELADVYQKRAEELSNTPDFGRWKSLNASRVSSGEEKNYGPEDIAMLGEPKSSAQIRNIAGLTPADISMTPGITAEALGMRVDPIVSGVEVARGIAQKITKILNNELKTKYGKNIPKGEKKFIDPKEVQNVISEYYKKFNIEKPTEKAKNDVPSEKIKSTYQSLWEISPEVEIKKIEEGMDPSKFILEIGEIKFQKFRNYLYNIANNEKDKSSREKGLKFVEKLDELSSIVWKK